MLENEFFPTPDGLIAKMLSAFNGRSMRYDKRTILDPNGGSGAILDYLKDNLDIPKSRLYTIEINQDLRYTLQGKGYKILDTDFLQYSEPCKFGIILMNPPFSEGVKHVLKAWEVLDDDGDLVSLINSETVQNPFSKERQLLQTLIKDYGSVEHLGQRFKEADRKTDVEVSLIRLKKPAKETNNYFEGMGFDSESEHVSEDFSPNTLAHSDAVKDLVSRYEVTRKILIDRHESQSKLNFYLSGISNPVLESVDRDKTNCMDQSVSLNDQLAVLKSRFWNTVFVKTKMGEQTTSDFRNKFSDFSRTQSSMAFTEANVKDVLELFFFNRAEIMKDCLVKVFDQATSYHDKNKIHTEGWKTNKSYKLNKRIIMPWGVTHSDNLGFSPNYRIQDFLNDLDKIMCWLSGVNPEIGVNTYWKLNNHVHSRDTDYRESFESHFFTLRYFKKGTLHIDFKDHRLLDEFNRQAAEGKKWIGGGY